MGRKTGITKTCEVCEKPFYIQKCRADRAKYCSRKCQRTAWSGSADLIEAFWSKVDKSAGPDGCWLYTGFRKWDGYGWLARKMDGKVRWLTAHRYAWMVAHGGEPADGLHILHKCDNPPCCNPAHLQLGTHQENMADMAAKGRANGGYHRSRRPVLHPNRVRPRRQA